jgi:hypothetical protein
MNVDKHGSLASQIPSEVELLEQGEVGQWGEVAAELRAPVEVEPVERLEGGIKAFQLWRKSS